MQSLANPSERKFSMFGFDMDNSAFDDSCLNAGMSCNEGMSVGVDSHMGGTHGIAFGRTGDASFDSLMDEVDKFNTETRQLGVFNLYDMRMSIAQS